MTSADPVEGVLPVDKPAGPTSHDVVAMTRRALHVRRVGHTGTLDPFASGLLLLCIGRATRIVEFLLGLPKRYHAVLRLGQATDTDDRTGAVVAESVAWRQVDRAALDAVLAQFRGDIEQVPATFSAKKQAGVRAYSAARQGRALTLPAASVRIDVLDVMQFDPPFVRLDVACSSGTYVRALARDIGQALGVGAHLSELRRTAIGAYRVESAIPPDALLDAARVAAALIRTSDALGDMPRVELAAADAARIRHGQLLLHPHAPGTIALVAENELLAIADADGERIRPRKVFST
jgi:tRNA pseudouridine55 synthase